MDTELEKLNTLYPLLRILTEYTFSRKHFSSVYFAYMFAMSLYYDHQNKSLVKQNKFNLDM